MGIQELVNTYFVDYVRYIFKRTNLNIKKTQKCYIFIRILESAHFRNNSLLFFNTIRISFHRTTDENGILIRFQCIM